MIYNALCHLSEDVVVPFQDDALVVGRDFHHLKNLDKVLQAYEDSGFILQIKKCRIFKESVDFLGFRVSRNGLATIPEYVTAVKKIEYPKTKKQVRALLGKFNYYRRHIFKFSEVIKPLSDLVRGKESKDDSNEKVVMTEEVRKAIDAMTD